MRKKISILCLGFFFFFAGLFLKTAFSQNFDGKSGQAEKRTADSFSDSSFFSTKGEEDQEDLITVEGLYSLKAEAFASDFALQHLQKKPWSPYRYRFYAIISSVDPKNERVIQAIQKNSNAEGVDILAESFSDRSNLVEACIQLSLFSCAKAELQILWQDPSSKKREEKILQALAYKLLIKAYHEREWEVATFAFPLFDQSHAANAEKEILRFLKKRIDFEQNPREEAVENLLGLVEKSPHIFEDWRVDFALALARKVKKPKAKAQAYQRAYGLASQKQNKKKVQQAQVDDLFFDSLEKDFSADSQPVKNAIAFLSAEIPLQTGSKKESMLIQRAWFYQKTGQQKKANEDWAFLKKSSNPETLLETYQFLAQQYVAKGDYFSANFLLQKGIMSVKEGPQKARFHVLKMENDYKNHQCAFAHHEFSLQPWEQYPFAKEAYFWNAECYFQEKNYAKAVHFYSKIALPSSLEFKKQLYQSYLYLGKKKEAENWKKTQAVSLADKKDFQRIAFQIYLSKKDYRMAELIFYDALGFLENENEKMIWFTQAALLYKAQKNLPALEKIYAQLIQLNPENFYGYGLELTDFYLRQKLYSQAYLFWQKGAKNKTGQEKEKILIQLAKLDYEIFKKPNLVLTHLKPIVAKPQSPNFPLALQISVESYILLQQLEKAAQFLAPLLSALPSGNPQKPALLFRLAEIEQAAKNWAEAQKNYQLFLKVYPQHPLASRAEKEKKAIEDYIKTEIKN